MATNRLSKTVADMWRSLALVFLFVALVALLGPMRPLLLPGKTPAVTTVDYRTTVQFAARAAGRPVLAPVGLPTGWKATSDRLTGGPASGGGPMELHLGFVTPAKQYAGVEQTTGPATAFLDQQVGDGVPVERTVPVDGVPWDLRRTAQRNELALSRTANGLTVVVTGSAGLGELRTLAASLRTS